MYLDKKRFLDFLKVGSKLVSENNLSVLGKYLLEFTFNGLCIYATDLKSTVLTDITYTKSVLDLGIPFEYNILVDKSVLKEIINLCGKSIYITYAGGTVCFDGMELSGSSDIENYPQRTFVRTQKGIISGKLHAVSELQHVVKFVSDDMTRPHMAGVCFEICGSNVDCIAVNGIQLGCSFHTGTADLDREVQDSVIVPGLELLSGVKDDYISFMISPFIENKSRLILFETKMFSLIVHAIQGQFPNWRRIVPDKVNPPTIIRGIRAKMFLKEGRDALVLKGAKFPNTQNGNLVTVHFQDSIAILELNEFTVQIPALHSEFKNKVMNYFCLKDIFIEDGDYSWFEMDNPVTPVLVTRGNLLFVFQGRNQE